MRVIRLEDGSWELEGVGMGFRSMRLRTRLLLSLIPSVVLILAVTGYITHWFANRFLQEALDRNVATQTLGMAHELEIFLHQCREDLLIMARQPVAQNDLLKAVEARKAARGYMYREVAFISPKAKENVFLLDIGRGAMALRSQDLSWVKPSPLHLLDRIGEMKPDTVWVSEILQVDYPPSADGSITQPITSQVIRMATPYFAEGTSPKGILMVALDLRQLREIMSLFNSPRSPLFAFARSPEPRYSFLFDREGWMLFQSETAEDQAKELSVEMARDGLSGTFGRPGLEKAFKPHETHALYWKMVKEVFQGTHGVLRSGRSSGEVSTAQGYAPVRFTSSKEAQPTILFGICFVDRSRLPLWAGYRQIDVMFVMTLISIFLISAVIFATSEALTRSILRMAGKVKEMVKAGKLETLEVEAKDYETRVLKGAINQMILTLKEQMAQIQARDQQLELERQREKVRLEEEIRTLKTLGATPHLDEIVGVGPLVERLKAEIVKAAAVEADVLIIGETGTGKQLVAEAIHRNSSRSQKPFISINCGALEESLLMDSLFGHVKGAFTEAKEDRKGAFLAAHKGTLFLDEIGTASPKVQQALLRAISMRKIRPLGSDMELDVDVRLIAASNVELQELVQQGLFREDLYYRLEVLTIRTPPLREHPESIPLLVEHFLKQAARLMNKEGVGLSRGALEKLKNYSWPGNVRELMNCLTRALAMSSSSLILAEDITLGEKGFSKPQLPEHIPLLQPASPKAASLVPLDLNHRQRQAWPVIQKQGRITRLEYQEVFQGKLPPRTALYDLQDMVARGFLRKIGKGPATQYEVVYPAKTGNPA